MANIKDLKKKIRSTNSTLKITTAMKLVSAAKLNKAQQAINNARPYVEELSQMVFTISALLKDHTHAFLQERENNRAILLVVSSNKGLCGGYNSQLVKKVRSFLSESERDFQVFFIGKKGRDVLKEQVNYKETFSFSSWPPAFEEIKKMGEALCHFFESKEVGGVYMAYNEFRSAISFTPTVKKILPMVLDPSMKEKYAQKYPFDFKYEPDAEHILNNLIPEAYISTIHMGILSALAAEHGARMSAMDNATRNSKEIIRNLTLKMNKLRQASITTELMEVISGAESLES
ncbi:MAG: ATP synthase F1 subunit gamma [Halobacteriovoraceae bacterium]|nr:ATP synthase F1 subunit gamma [Halobacteriovoraceae bacterium]